MNAAGLAQYTIDLPTRELDQSTSFAIISHMPYQRNDSTALPTRNDDWIDDLVRPAARQHHPESLAAAHIQSALKAAGTMPQSARRSTLIAQLVGAQSALGGKKSPESGPPVLH